MEVRGRRCRELSPERAKVCVQARDRVIKPTFRKVQVVYYLSRNGQLEHPHFIEVTHLAHQQLRLKDVIDRLTVLRGKGMPPLYAWSCKRSYKNGYVWNDLAENDVIHPSEGAEYVLKGSELIEGSTEKLQQLHVVNNNSNAQLQDPNFQPKRKQLAFKRNFETNQFEEDEDENEGGEEEEYEEKSSSSTTPHSRCSRGVSTDEIEEDQETIKNPTSSSPPSTTSSSTVVSDKANNENTTITSKRFEDGDPVAAAEAGTSRNSVLFQLIACGGSVSFRGNKSTAPDVSVNKQQPAPPPPPPPPTTMVARKSSSLHKGVLAKTAAAAAAVKVDMVEEDEMIKCMSENPRFGNMQSEEKEYFSGSIVESMTEERVKVEPSLKRSSSYKEERSTKVDLGDAVEEEMKRENGVKGRCMPGRKKSSSKQSKK